MKKIAPDHTVDAPFLSKEEAIEMPEFCEGQKAHAAGKSIIDNPYSITKQSELRQEVIGSAEWRVEFENRFEAWMFGFNAEISQSN